MTNSRVLRDKRSGRFLGSVGVGKRRVPSSSSVLSQSERDAAQKAKELETEAANVLREQRFAAFTEKYPWYRWNEKVGNGATTFHRIAESGDYGDEPRSIFTKIVERAYVRQYKAVSKASVEKIDSFVNRTNKDSLPITFGLLVNPNLSEDQLMALASRVTAHQWMEVYIHHPAAGEKFLGTIASSRFNNNHDQRREVASLFNLPLSVQNILASDDSDEVRRNLINNPVVSDDVKVAAALFPNNGNFDIGTISDHPYVFPLSEKFKSRLPKVKEK